MKKERKRKNPTLHLLFLFFSYRNNTKTKAWLLLGHRHSTIYIDCCLITIIV
jgi:hypothetical protein